MCRDKSLSLANQMFLILWVCVVYSVSIVTITVFFLLCALVSRCELERYGV